MKCEVIQDLLSCYVDGTCSDETKKLVEEHLNECEECRKLYEELANVSYEVYPMMHETKPFLKVKRDFLKKLLLILCVFSLIFVFAGSTIVGTIMKERMKWYVNENYAHLNLEMTSFSYRDPSAQGFGVNNAYYYASFTDPNQIDMNFAVFTEGFFLKIVDNYDHQINEKYSVIWRLVEEYQNDVDFLLKKEFKDVYVCCSVGLSDESQYDYHEISLNQKYDRSVDQHIPMALYIEVSEQSTDELVAFLKEEGFNPPDLTIALVDENKGS